MKAKYLLALDLDGTLVGDDLALSEFSEYLGERREQFWLAYVTGRTAGSAVSLFDLPHLPCPDFLVCDVGGTLLRPSPEIQLLNEMKYWKQDPLWARHMELFWQPQKIRQIARQFRTLRPQPEDCQSDYKISFEAVSCPTSAQAVLSEVFRMRRIHANIIVSQGRLMDIVPRYSGKLQAVNRLTRWLALGFDEVFVCGDSCNDLDMLTSNYHSACVANSEVDLLTQLPSRVRRTKGAYAAGVLEALRDLGWLRRPIGGVLNPEYYPSVRASYSTTQSSRFLQRR